MRQLLPYLFVSDVPIGWKCSECEMLFRIEGTGIREHSKGDHGRSITLEFLSHQCSGQRVAIAASDTCPSTPEFPQLSSRKMTTRAAEFASDARMYVYDEISWEQFEQKFFEAFGRVMTPDEHHWFHSIWAIVNDRTKQKSKGAAA